MEQAITPLVADCADYYSSELRYLEDYLMRKHGTLRDIKSYRVVKVSAGEKYSRPVFEIYTVAKPASKVTGASK